VLPGLGHEGRELYESESLLIFLLGNCPAYLLSRMADHKDGKGFGSRLPATFPTQHRVNLQCATHSNRSRVRINSAPSAIAGVATMLPATSFTDSSS